MQCGILCHNKITSLRLVIKVNRPLYFNATSLLCLRLGLHLFAFDISYIKHAITYFIINSFIGIVSKAAFEYSYEVGKLSSKFITMFSSRMNIFKYVS
jgi:hypothetical protein